jgi:Na+-translocating ferredoxin:NAD+ oxidoreductase RnfC subunit
MGMFHGMFYNAFPIPGDRSFEERFQAMTSSVIEQIRRNGVVGAGGAGFPTHVKLQAPAEVFLVNAAECEPLLHKDKELMKRFPDEMIRGLQMAMAEVGAKEGVIGIKGKYQDVIDILEPKLPENVRIHRLGDYYPAGDEFCLVYEVTGRVIPPGGLPKDVDAVCSNVETLINIAIDRPVIRKFLSVVADVAEPVTVGVPIGTPMRDVLTLAGGANSPEFGILEGGAMMGKLVEDPEKPVTKTTGGMIVLPDDHELLRIYRRDYRGINSIGRAACDQCSFCTEMCPRYLLGHPIEPHKAMRGLGFIQDRVPNLVGTYFCCECNLCTIWACPESLDPKNVCVQSKVEMRKEGIKWEGSPPAMEVHPVREGRQIPVKRLTARLGLSQYRNVGPLIEETVQPAYVILPLKQHVGAPAEPLVRQGERVEEGQVIAAPPDGALGAVIHASIAGTVREVTDSIIIDAG